MTSKKSESKQKYMLQILDVSKKILLESSSQENQQMVLLNSTISHEMRNPLHSIHIQIQVLADKI